MNYYEWKIEVIERNQYLKPGLFAEAITLEEYDGKRDFTDSEEV